MTAPKRIEQGYDYTEFDGMPPEWWQAYRRRHKSIVSSITEEAHQVIAEVIPNAALHKHVARVAKSHEEGHTTLLTTSGGVIQFQEPKPTREGRLATKGAIYFDANIDAKGISLVMAAYERDGFKLSADQIPFGKSWTDEGKKNRIRKLWAEVESQQQPQAGVWREVVKAARPVPGRTTAYA